MGETFCERTGKVRHGTRVAACRAMRLLAMARPDGMLRQVFQCDACGDFHFGRPLRKVRLKPPLRRFLSWEELIMKAKGRRRR